MRSAWLWGSIFGMTGSPSVCCRFRARMSASSREPRQPMWSLESAQVVIRWVRPRMTPLPSRTHVTIHTDEGLLGNQGLRISCLGGARAVKIMVFISLSSWQRCGWETFIFDLLKGWIVCEKNVSDPPIMMSESRAWDGFQRLGGKNAKANEEFFFFLSFYSGGGAIPSWLREKYLKIKGVKKI